MRDDEVLTVRFHFNGEFVLDGSQMQYCNGDFQAWGCERI